MTRWNVIEIIEKLQPMLTSASGTIYRWKTCVSFMPASSYLLNIVVLLGKWWMETYICCVSMWKHYASGSSKFWLLEKILIENLGITACIAGFNLFLYDDVIDEDYNILFLPKRVFIRTEVIITSGNEDWGGIYQNVFMLLKLLYVRDWVWVF